jgi:hypothetical protein
MKPWMVPFAKTIDAAKKYVVSSSLGRVDWNAELLRGDLGECRSAAQAAYRLEAREPARAPLGAVAMRHEPRR